MWCIAVDGVVMYVIHANVVDVLFMVMLQAVVTYS